MGEKIVISGDARHDSMGHCAKYGAYTVFCSNTAEIIHFSLVQVFNQLQVLLIYLTNFKFYQFVVELSITTFGKYNLISKFFKFNQMNDENNLYFLLL